MGHTGRMIMRAIAVAVMAGAIAFGAVGAVGVAGASAPAVASLSASGAGAQGLAARSGKLTHFNCARADTVLARIQKVEARIAAGLPKLTAAEAKARGAGHTRRADRIQHLLAKLEDPTLKGRLDKLASGIEAKCQVAAPAAG